MLLQRGTNERIEAEADWCLDRASFRGLVSMRLDGTPRIAGAEKIVIREPSRSRKNHNRLANIRWLDDMVTNWFASSAKVVKAVRAGFAFIQMSGFTRHMVASSLNGEVSGARLSRPRMEVATCGRHRPVPQRGLY